MGWKQYVRQMEAQARRDERAAVRRFREMERESRRQDKEAKVRDAAYEVARYETYLELVVSLHSECGDAWNWHQLSLSPPPAEPPRSSRREDAARALRDAYAPGFVDRMFGGAKRRRDELEAAVQQERARDDAEYACELAAYRNAFASWQTRIHLAPGVMRLDLRSCRDALVHAGSFHELGSFRAEVTLDSIVGDLATLSCFVDDPEIIPSEEVKLTAGGKLTSKEMATGKYWGLYQDHVCSAALRVARESFAVLQVARANVNVSTRRLNTSTGHVEGVCILGVQFTRRGISSLRIEGIDPSDAMKNFNHRMKFKKASGFEPVVPTSDADQWITT